LDPHESAYSNDISIGLARRVVLTGGGGAPIDFFGGGGVS